MATPDTQVRQGKIPFRDDINFPRGISRSGSFSISQSELLTVYGDTLKSLELGTLAPANRAEKDFVACCRGEKLAETQLEKLWLKYHQVVQHSRSFHTMNGNRKSAANEASFTASYDNEDIA